MTREQVTTACQQAAALGIWARPINLGDQRIIHFKTPGGIVRRAWTMAQWEDYVYHYKRQRKAAYVS